MPEVRFLIVTTIVRRAPLGEPSGYIWILDSDRRSVVLRTPVPDSRYRASDPNPRGGLRGGRGVWCWQDRLVIANNETLFLFDRNWKLVNCISHPLMGGVHDILAVEDGIWVTCTHSDLLVKVDWKGNLIDQWEWRKDRSLRAAFELDDLPQVDLRVDFRDPNAARRHVYNTIHLNAVCPASDGLLLSFGRVLSPAGYRKKRRDSAFSRLASAFRLNGLSRKSVSRALDKLRPRMMPSPPDNSCSAIVLLHADRTSKVLHRVTGIAEPNHNVWWHNDTIVFNDTNQHAVVAFSPSSRRDPACVRIPGESPFVRGLLHDAGSVYWAGSQAPLALYQVDVAAGRRLSTWELDSSPFESVYGICAVPSIYETPRSLEFS